MSESTVVSSIEGAFFDFWGAGQGAAAAPEIVRDRLKVAKSIVLFALIGLALLVLGASLLGLQISGELEVEKPTVALTVGLLGLSLLLNESKKTSVRQLAAVMSFAAAVVAFVPIGTGPMARAALDTSLMLSLAALAAASFGWAPNWRGTPLLKGLVVFGRVAVGICACFASFTILSNLFAPPELSDIRNGVGLAQAMDVAIVALGLCFATALAGGADLPIALLARRTPEGRLARWLMIMLVGGLLVLGWLAAKVVSDGVVSQQAVALATSSSLAALTVPLVILAMRRIETVNAARGMAERLVREIIDSSPDVVFMKNLRGEVVLGNSEFMRVVSHLSPGAAGVSFTPGKLAEQERRVVALKSKVAHEETCAVNGEQRTFLTRHFPVFNASENLVGVCAIGIDITERKRLELELERKVAERTRELTNANEELEAFSYSVSHDLRAPLRSMDGFSRILLESHADRLDETARGYLERVRAASQQMAGLIDDLLTLSRAGRTELVRERVDLSALAIEIITERRRLEPSREVKFRVAPGLVDQADTSLLRIVLWNLLDNAWKYTAKNPSAEIEFFSEVIDDCPVYVVRDNGVGFDMARKARLFRAFERLHAESEFPGTGIGLVTAHRILERHGGSIWAKSAPGKGAAFYFTLRSTPDKAREVENA